MRLLPKWPADQIRAQYSLKESDLRIRRSLQHRIRLRELTQVERLCGWINARHIHDVLRLVGQQNVHAGLCEITLLRNHYSFRRWGASNNVNWFCACSERDDAEVQRFRAVYDVAVVIALRNRGPVGVCRRPERTYVRLPSP